jgi:hypothetical protein
MSIRLFVRLTACISAAPAERIFTNLISGTFVKICREIPNLIQIEQKIWGTLRVDLSTFLLLPATLNRHKSALCERNSIGVLG